MRNGLLILLIVFVSGCAAGGKTKLNIKVRTEVCSVPLDINVEVKHK